MIRPGRREVSRPPAGRTFTGEGSEFEGGVLCKRRCGTFGINPTLNGQSELRPQYFCCWPGSFVFPCAVLRLTNFLSRRIRCWHEGASGSKTLTGLFTEGG